MCPSLRGRISLFTKADESAQPGYVNLPHGYGLSSTAKHGNREVTGAQVNELTSAEACDPIAKTPVPQNCAG